MSHSGQSQSKASSFLVELQRELRESIQAGAALAAMALAAGCGGESTATDPEPPAPTETYAADQLACYGESPSPQLYGPCCLSARCYTPPSGAACASPTSLGAKIPLPTGSGECGCTIEGHAAIEGPFAPNPDHTPDTPGTCCYVVTGAGCTGRPLVIDGEQRVARAMLRDDWLVA